MYTHRSIVASGAEKLEQDLRNRPKNKDITLKEVELLLTHPLLEGLVSQGKGAHVAIVKCPYKGLRKFAREIAQALGDPKVESYIMKDGFDVDCHGNRVRQEYVKDILEFIEVRRKLKENNLEGGGT